MASCCFMFGGWEWYGNAVTMLVIPSVSASSPDHFPKDSLSDLLNPVMLVLKVPVTAHGIMGREVPSCPKPIVHFRSIGAPILKHLVQCHHSGSNVPLSR